jgi:hypothetical protein
MIFSGRDDRVRNLECPGGRRTGLTRPSASGVFSVYFLKAVGTLRQLEDCCHARSGGGEDVVGFLLGYGDEGFQDVGIELGSAILEQAGDCV